ncbi:cyclin-T1-5-like isoform X4 [Durio zibethinus]|uniref:Cyclin-T1-5-like isoform X4 n=1 Tax=Durio zibethinus TaxID=66656 RepID=A0A6P6AB95_DURZI|nr:cyclin-T1-5-like isoform X4 [Durio zibethinus]
MSFARNCRMQGGIFQDDYQYPFDRNNYNNNSSNNYRNRNWNWNSNLTRNCNYAHEFFGQFGEHNRGYYHAQPNCAPLKRRKFSAATWGDNGRHYPPSNMHHRTAPLDSCNFVPPSIRLNAEASTSVSSKCGRSQLEDDEHGFMSRDEIERYSPSRRDGIDALCETHLRYSYCAFIQNLGLQLDLPQTTIGTAMVLCHRFFVRRSHACHDRFDWFEQYRERVIEAEQMILTTLNFELNVQHPYAPLTSILNKLGLSQTVLVNLALNLVSEGLRSSLWLQFKPHHIAAGAAYLAAKFLSFDLASYHDIWQEFQTTPAILKDVSQQLMELF